MIDAKDLMIGNWVKVIYQDSENNGVYRVAMSCKNIVTLDYIEEDNSVIRFQNDYIFPIPVTPELLERIGFKKEYDELCELIEWCYDTDDYHLSVKKGSNSINKDWHCHIDNTDWNTIGSGDFGALHQLQNLARVITGKDLPITKEMLG